MGVCERNMRSRGGDGVSRARDDRLTFQGCLGAVRLNFLWTGPGVAGLLACLCSNAWGKRREANKFGARAMAGPGDWA